MTIVVVTTATRAHRLVMARLVALLLVLGSCNIDHSCALVFCDSGAIFPVSTFSESDFARLTGATITICFNGWCNEGVIDALPDPGGIHSISLGSSSEPTVKLSLQRFDPDSEIRLGVDVESDRVDLFRNGDVYAVDVVGMDGASLVHASWSVDYADSQPNGDGCDPTCRMAATMTPL
jgi:hypothetical protein